MTDEQKAEHYQEVAREMYNDVVQPRMGRFFFGSKEDYIKALAQYLEATHADWCDNCEVTVCKTCRRNTV